MLKIIIPEDQAKLKRQILALEGLLLQDNEKDRAIHHEALHELRKALA